MDPPITSVHAVSNPQDDPEQSRIGRVAVLALARVAEGGRVIRVEPNTIVGEGLMEVLGPAHADRLPVPRLDLRPLDLDGGVSLHDLAVVGMCERLGRPLRLL